MTKLRDTLLIAFVACLVLVSALGTTRNAATAAYVDVKAQTDVSDDGDTVNVPAGTPNWAANTLTLTKCITLIGAGSTSTVIQTNDGNWAIDYAPTVDMAFSVHDIGFTKAAAATSTQFGFIQITGSGYSGGTHSVTLFRIYNNKFTYGTRQVNTRGYAYGKIDHNSFTDPNIAFGCSGDNTTAWGRTIGPDGFNTVVFEDNTGTYTAGASTTDNEFAYLQEGARAIIRHNTVDGTAYNGQTLFVDVHGNYGNGVQDPNTAAVLVARGSPWVNINNNNVHVKNTYRWVHIRGGEGALYANTFVADSANDTNVMSFTEEEGWQTVLFNPLLSVKPANDPIKEWYIYSNTLNGSSNNNVETEHGSDATFVILNTDYFKRAMQSGDLYFPFTEPAYPDPQGLPSGTTTTGKVTITGKVTFK